MPNSPRKTTRTHQSRQARRIPEAPGEILSADILAVSKGGFGDARYLSVSIDHFSGWTDVLPLTNKDAKSILGHLQSFINWIRNQTQMPVKIFRSDRGQEYDNEKVIVCFALMGRADSMIESLL